MGKLQGEAIFLFLLSNAVRISSTFLVQKSILSFLSSREAPLLPAARITGLGRILCGRKEVFLTPLREKGEGNFKGAIEERDISDTTLGRATDS